MRQYLKLQCLSVSSDNPDEEDEVDLQPFISKSSVSLTVEDGDQ